MLKYCISLKSVKSQLDGIKLFEVFNKTNLNKLIDSNVLNTTPWNNFENEKQQLEDYRHQSVNYEFCGNINDYGIVPVKYKRVNGYSFGRVYPIKSLSLCTIRREIRHTIGNDIYIDIDISNCHPELIYQTCKHHNIKCDILEEYVKNRDNKLEEVQNKYSVSREQAKKLFIILLYFGSFNTWVKELNLENLDNNINPTEFITNFINERNVYGKAIEDVNEDIYLEVQSNKTKKNQFEYNEMASVVSIWCQEIENRILETVYKYCLKKKYIKDKLAVLCYDGIMIEISKFKLSILDEFTKLIRDTFGYNLKYVQKKLNEGYNNLLDNKTSIESMSEEDDIEDIDSSINNDSICDIKKSDKKFFKNLEFVSHSQMAEIFYNLNRDKYVYSSISGWYKYNEYYVLECTGNNLPSGLNTHISKCLLEYLIPIRNRMKPNNPTYVKDCKNLNKLIKDVSNAGYIFGIIRFLQDLYSNENIDNKVDNNSNLIAFIDKVFDKKILNFRDIRPDDYISKTTRYKYKKSDKKIRKNIRDIVKSIFEDDEMEIYFLKMKAHSLFGNIGENVFICTGSGSNGKGLIGTAEKGAYGDYIMTTENTFLTSTFKQGQANSTLGNCKGIRNLIISEPSDMDEFQRETPLNTAFLKLITGNDDITTRELYKSNFSFKPLFTPWLQANHMPYIKKIDKGIMRRIKVICFPYMFVDNPIERWERKIDRSLKALFETEDYYREYMLLLLDIFVEHNNYDSIKIPDSVMSESSKYFNDNNPVKNFIDSFIKHSAGNKIKSSEVKAHFDDNFEEKLTSSLFLKAMKTNGYDTIMHHGYKKFIDIDICNPPSEEDKVEVEIDMD
jgi:P4 family phage/plasmid primase-like protien